MYIHLPLWVPTRASWGGLGGAAGWEGGCLTISSAISIFSWTLGYCCLPVELFIFPF